MSDPRRRVVARLETDPFPAGAYHAVTERLLDGLFADWSLTGGTTLVELDAEGLPVDTQAAEIAQLRAQVAEVAEALRVLRRGIGELEPAPQDDQAA